MIRDITIEICAGSLSDVLAASSVRGTDRIELNSALELGGLTPSAETLRMAREMSDRKLICMVRPRPAGFVYNETEKASMMKDAEAFLKDGADGIVFGCLKEDLTVDEEYTKQMSDLIHRYGKEAVFHKAFDETPDLFEACRTLAECGIDRILTSGGKEDVSAGADMIRDLQKAFGSKIEILPGGGVSETNAANILKHTGCRNIHMSAKRTCHDCGDYYAVDPERIRKIIQTIEAAKPKHLSGEDIMMLRNDTYENTVISYEDDGRDRY